MPNVASVSVIKILGITFTNHLSVAEHVQTVINSSAQTLYVLITLRAHGMDDACSASDGFSVCRHSQADLRLKRVVGFRNHHRQTGNDFRHSFDEVIVVDLYHQASHL